LVLVAKTLPFVEKINICLFLDGNAGLVGDPVKVVGYREVASWVSFCAATW